MYELEPALTRGEQYELEVAAAREAVQDLSQLEMFNGDATATMRYRIARIPEMYSDGAVRVTPLVEVAPGVLYKDERQQVTGAFKPRGGFASGWLALEKEPEVRELIACSAGNHAQGVAQFVNWHNTNFGWGLTAHAFMAESASPAKKAALAIQGAEIHDAGFTTLEQAREGAQDFANDSLRPAATIDPYAAAETIAGQGTILTETLLQLWEADIDTTAKPLTVYVGWGGGGLALGQAHILAQLVAKGYVHPESKIVAVQEERTDSGIRGLERYDQGNTDMTGLFLPGEFSAANDGSAVQVPDLRNIALAQKYCDEGFLEFMRVAKADVGRAMVDNPGTEPAGALSIAGQYRHQSLYVLQGQPDTISVCVVSGGNLTRDKFAEYKDAYMATRGSISQLLGGHVVRSSAPGLPIAVGEYLLQLDDMGIELLDSSVRRSAPRR